jgi:hypothetical protein
MYQLERRSRTFRLWKILWMRPAVLRPTQHVWKTLAGRVIRLAPSCNFDDGANVTKSFENAKKALARIFQRSAARPALVVTFHLNHRPEKRT